MTPFRGKLRIRHLEIVLMVADQGGLSKAASQLNMTQSGLSRAIAEIEECVDGRLFERSAKGMVCTPLGLAMCRHASILLSDFGKAEADLAAVARGELGSLTVGCFAMFSGWPLADAVRGFRETHPQVALTIQMGTHERLIEDLDSGSLDVLISRYTSSLDPMIYRSISLLNDSVVLTCSIGHPLAASANPKLADCARYPWLTALPGGRIRRELDDMWRRHSLAPPAMIGALSLEFGMAMLSSGEGNYVWMLPGSVAAALQARGALCVLPVDLQLATFPLAAIWRRDRSSTRQVRAFTAALARIAREGQAT
jgi:DNA-binding transcriptional LysR family regulator